MSEPASPSIPSFDPNAPHHARPKLRQIKGFPAQVKGQPALGVADARQISRKVVFTSPAAQQILPLMDGTRSVDEIVVQVGQGLERRSVELLVAQLDDAALLHGPRFDEVWADFTRTFDSSESLPPSNSADYAEALVKKAHEGEVSEEQLAEESPRALRGHFDELIDRALKDVQDPSLNELPAGLIAPSIDYGRGGLIYASVYGRLRVVDRPDRVIVLGPNHYGRSSGVCGCDKGFQSPLGECRIDKELADRLRSSLGEGLFEHRYDHEREHSIELQVPWIQHVFGADEDGNFPKIFAALVHDAAANNGESYDGKGVAIQPFVDAVREALADLGGKTLVVTSFDLSHVGPMFGDQVQLLGDSPQANKARNDVVQHDREMLDLLAQGKPEEMVAAMAWQQNPTRWSSTGPIVAGMGMTAPSKVRVLNYQGAIDQNGHVMVSMISGVIEHAD
ncbi:MAG: AmmeMemoRadiSam system protein B [Phycisphaeraceae bacterium]|nr:AmmeMemoRadiSam system protein B [Phycisphaeraceae bacterium]